MLRDGKLGVHKYTVVCHLWCALPDLLLAYLAHYVRCALSNLSLNHLAHYVWCALLDLLLAYLAHYTALLLGADFDYRKIAISRHLRCVLSNLSLNHLARYGRVAPRCFFALPRDVAEKWRGVCEFLKNASKYRRKNEL